MVSFQWGVFENSIFSLLQDDYIWIRIIYGRCQVTMWIWWVSFLLSSHHLLTCRTTTCGGDHRFLWGEILVTLSVLNHTNTYKYNIPPKKKNMHPVCWIPRKIMEWFFCRQHKGDSWEVPHITSPICQQNAMQCSGRLRPRILSKTASSHQCLVLHNLNIYLH